MSLMSLTTCLLVFLSTAWIGAVGKRARLLPHASPTVRTPQVQFTPGRGASKVAGASVKRLVAPVALQEARTSGQRLLSQMRAEATTLNPLDKDEKVLAYEKDSIVDEEEMLAKSTFPIKPSELISKAITFLAYDQGVSKPELIAEDFEFVGPVVGPLSKSAFVKAVGGFDFKSAFPDANPEFHHFRVDPFEPNRVWMTARGRGTNTGEGTNPLFAKPTGKNYVNPPQACSLKFNEQGLVTQYTIGYVMDRRIGNTGGLGGVYGILYALGKPLPFPEAQPWKMSKRYKFFQWLGRTLDRLSKDKK